MPCGCGSKADAQASIPTTPSAMETNTTSDLFKADRRTIDTQKVLFSLWKYRAKSNYIANAILTFSKFIDEKRVYNEIEFYLPQLAHLIIHLDSSTPANVAALENLALLLARTSIHTAQQLTFILIAALQDYQPENADGRKNPNSNFSRYSRCAGVLKRIERVVVVGDLSPPEPEYKQSGFLMFKRVVRKSPLRTKGWKRRFFSVQNGILGCYRNADDKEPIRSMLLPGCTLEDGPASFSHPFTFSVYHKTSYIQFNLRAADENEFKTWVVFLKNAIDPAAVEIVGNQRGDSKSPFTPRTKGEVNRENFFHQQQLFVNNLTEISERLRFQDRDVRKYFLRRDMTSLITPPFCYLPLCTSLTPFRCVLRALPMESHAFSTKARCPALMLFEVEEHPAGNDTATFLGAELQHYDELSIHEVGAQSFVSYNESDLQFNPASDDVMPPLHLAAKESRFNRSIAQSSQSAGSSFWVEEGAGMKRLKDTTTKAGAISPVPTGNGATDPQALTDTLELGIALIEEAPGSSFTESIGARPRVESVATSHPMDLRSTITAHSHTLGGDALTQMVDSIEVKHGPLLNKETYDMKAARLHHQSPFRDLPNWKIVGLIAKSNDDVRQEVFVMQLIMYYQIAFKNEKVPVYLHTYRILSTSKTTGIIQLIPNAVSLDGLKKELTYPDSLRGYFELTYGTPGGPNGDQEPPELAAALNEYVKSLAGYSIVTYLLAIKDRHNGNIMIDTCGHLVHIDFGFVFGLAPGKAFSMEKAPFKLTEEMVAVMGGIKSKHFNKYEELCVDAFKAARKHQRVVIRLMEIMSYCSNYPSFKYNKNAIPDFRRRLMLHVPDEMIAVEVKKLVSMSYKHTGTVLYDRFQLATNGIAI